ncbi:MAG: hypothetical protein COB60_12670 [Flavobacteriaceae bacterium]|nr:MAG: hypothetical protein COB60_12670 [Flavobacteriaceae bacterium]
MKKVVVLIVLFIGGVSHAQQEIKVDLLDALALKTMGISYEYYINDQSSVGVSALVNFEKQSADFRYNEDRMITPYFRHYFTTNQNWNMFGEVFFAINKGEKKTAVIGSNTKIYKKYSDGALGVSVGTKYYSNAGFVLDIYAGLGRNMFTENSPSVVPRIGINVGYRF